MRLQNILRAAGLAACLSASFVGSAQAIILNFGAVDNSSISFSGGSGDRAGSKTLAVSDAGGSAANGLGNAVDGKSRFSWNVAADTGTSSSAASATLNGNYSVTFSITPDNATQVYSVQIDTSLLGGLTMRDDQSTIDGSGGTANISNLTGNISGGPLGTGTLSLASAASQGGTSNESGVQTVVSKNGVYTISGLQGAQSYTLNFTWTSLASSPSTNFLASGDEASARFGDNNPLGGADADNYPGNPSRTQANDGHFVTVTATITTVPEPSTYAMGIMAGLGAVLFGWRRRVG